jgi:hypothetical protein
MKPIRSLRSLKAQWSVLLGAVGFASIQLHTGYAQNWTNFIENFEAGNLNNWSVVSGQTSLSADNTKNQVPSTGGTWSGKITNTSCCMVANLPTGLGITAQSYKFSVWLYYNGLSKDSCEVRSYSGGNYGNGAYSQLLTIGTYNAATYDGSTDTTKFQGRVVYGGVPGANGWFTLNAPGCPGRSTGWHKLEIERGFDFLGQSILTFLVDGHIGKVWTNNAGGTWDTILVGPRSGTTVGNEWWDGFQVISGQAFITQDPASQAVTVDSAFDLTVGAIGDADPPHYQWYKNGTSLSGKTDASLHFDKLAYSDAGNYSVVVSNIFAVKTSAVAVLTVNAPLYVTVDPTSALVNPGDNVTFTATANGQGSFSYQWKKNGAPLSDKTDATLTFSPVANGDAGTYTVTVHNGIDSDATSNPALLAVNTPPSLPTLADTNAYIGQTFTLRVAATDDFTSQAAPFQAFETNTVGSRVTFANPYASGSTEPYVDGLGRTYVTNTFPAGHGSSRVLYSHFTFTNANNKNWLRLTTTDGSSSGVLAGNPIVSFATPLRFDMYTDKALAVGLGLRETGTTGPIGSNDGTSSAPLEEAGATSAAAPVTGTNIVPAGVWTTVVFNLPNVAVANFNGGNGVLDLSTGKGVLEHLSLTDGTTPGQTGDCHIWLDNFVCLPANALTFSLEDAPAGATIDSATGVITWTPTAPAHVQFTVRAIDHMGLSSTTSFYVNAAQLVRPNLTIRLVGSNVVVDWADPSFSLQAAPTPTGTYTNVPGAAPGYSTAAGSGARFYRLAR